MLPRLLIFIILWTVALPLIAQKTSITHLSTSEGLSQGMVTTLIQDKGGFIWAGTLDGLNRYDGYHFKTFTHDPFDSNSISGNVIDFIFEDSKERIWIGVENNGLDCYDKKTGTFTHLGNKFPKLALGSPGIRQMVETEDGRLWINTYSEMLCLTIPPNFPKGDNPLSNVTLTTLSAFNNPNPNYSQLTIYLHNGHTVGLFLNGCIRLYDTKTGNVVQSNISPLLSGMVYLSYAYLPSENGYWFIKGTQLMHWKNGKVLENVPLPKHIYQDQYKTTTGLYVLPNGQVWAMSSCGFTQLYPEVGDKKNCTLDLHLTKGRVISAWVDRQKRVWMGTDGYGLYTAPLIQTPIQKIVTPSINWIRNTGKAVYARTANRLMVLQNNAELNLKPLSLSFCPPEITDFITLPNQTKYVIQNIGHDVYFRKYSASNVEVFHYLIPTGLNPLENKMMADKDGNVWVSIPDGKLACNFYGSDSMKIFSFQDLLPPHSDRCSLAGIYQSNDGLYWLSCIFGLIKMELWPTQKVRFSIYQNKPDDKHSLSRNYVLCTQDDPADPYRYLWVATKGGGINKMDKSTGICTHYTTHEGLPNNVVYSVLPDSMGRLWLSTNNGISCFMPQKDYFHNFTLADGLQDNEFNTAAFCQTPDGRLLFGGVSGINIISPNSFQFDTTFAQVWFTSLKINNRLVQANDSTGILASTIETAKRISLHYDQNFIDIAFTATNYNKLGTNSYRYRMEGVDKDWVNGENKNEVSYPNLSPGTYTLHVANSNENGDWNPNDAVLQFVISPPWWQTGLAYTFYTLAFLTGIFSFYQFQLKSFRMKNSLALKETELAFKAKETAQLQELDAFKGRFFANVTHELRTPLTLILEPVRRLIAEDNQIGQLHTLQIVYNNALRLLRLVNSLLDLSKLEAGKMNVYLSEGDVVQLVDTILASLRPYASTKNIEIDMEYPAQSMLIKTDKAMLEKITYNLLSNAIKFTKEGGGIDILISYSPTDDQWMLRISDSGIGIEPTQLPHIFERFYQVDNTHTRKGEGTGIGLSLVKELVTLLQGEIYVVSNPGEGTSFTILFPVNPAIEDISKQATEQEGSTDTNVWTTPLLEIEDNQQQSIEGQLNVLVVEDNQEMRHFIASVLIENGYSTTVAQNGQQGIDMALETVPDLIVSDLMMPIKDGFDLTITLKQNPITSHIPIVLLTAKANLDSKIEAYRIGADAYLNKPFHSPELLVRMHQLIEVRKTLQRKYSTNGIKEEDIFMGGETTPPQGYPLDDAFMDTVNSYVQQNIQDENLNIDMLATKLNMSLSQLYRKFNALTNLTPAKYIRNYRLDHARVLLATGNYRVNEAMQEVGFTQLQHFSKSFKERFGVTPQETKKKGMEI